jgi:glycosyltransferase involved in cell wall biosynthesis
MTIFDSTVAIGRRRAAINQYLERRQLYPFQIDAEPSPNLSLSIVIPCFNETDVGRVLASLSRCDPPDGAVEVLVVINAPDGAGQAVEANNARAKRQVIEATNGMRLNWLQFHAIQHNRLPPTLAGVGLARRIGMDEAAGRIVRSRGCDGVIVSLDADCMVSSDFMVRIDEEFRQFVDCPGISINFEHRIAEQSSDPIHQAMVNYELHLRYFVAGQRLAGFPYAFHTIGSAMACRGSIYAQQGGMNLRQGGEDFYFIQKLIALGGYRSLNRTTVYPGIRISNRVPFGTGPAIEKALKYSGTLNTFAPEVFADLKYFCEAVVESAPGELRKNAAGLPEPIVNYLESVNFSERVTEIERNVSSPAAFRKRIFRWFNAFRFLKYAQFASRHYYPKMQVSRAASELAESAGIFHGGEDLQTADLLYRYRQLDRAATERDFVKDLF